MYALIASSTPLLLTFPVEVTHCHDGRSIGGLSGCSIDAISSDVPPALGSQSIQPTLPGLFLHSGILTSTFIGQSFSVFSASPVPSQVTTVTGAVTGSTTQPDAASQVPCSSPMTAVAVVSALSVPIPMTRDTKESNCLWPWAWIPATGPTTPLGQSGFVWLFVGRTPPPT